jgi:hypothetical protein
MFADWSLAYLSSERLHVAPDQNRCRYSQPSIKYHSWNFVEELWEGLRNPKRTETPQEEKQSQLTLTLGGSQSLNHQLESKHGLDLETYTFVANMQFVLHADFSTTGADPVPEYVACLLILFP